MIVKPVMGVILAISPYYGAEGSSQALVIQLVTALNAGLLAELMALFKAVETIAVDASSAGACAPVRSFLEDVTVVILTLFIIIVGFPVALFCLCVTVGLIVVWVVRRKMAGKTLLPKCWCCGGGKMSKSLVDDSDQELGAREISRDLPLNEGIDSGNDEDGGIC